MMDRYHKLAQIVGSEKILRSPEELLAYSYDASRGRARAEIVALPACEEDVIKILGFAWENRVPVYPRGAGTGGRRSTPWPGGA